MLGIIQFNSILFRICRHKLKDEQAECTPEYTATGSASRIGNVSSHFSPSQFLPRMFANYVSLWQHQANMPFQTIQSFEHL